MLSGRKTDKTAIFSILGLDSVIDISSRVGVSSLVSDIGGLVLFAFSIASVFLLSRKKRAASPIPHPDERDSSFHAL